jgi:hypothetical protein
MRVLRSPDIVGMLQYGRTVRRLFAALLLLCVCPAVAAADDNPLRVPSIVASAAAAADWASTYHALKFYKVQEVNPLLRPFQKSPSSMITLGGFIDAGSVTAWNLTVGRKNERVAVAGLWGMAAFRAYLAIHNLRNERQSERR